MRKICVVTGSRAEYGLLYWLLRGIAADPELELQIIATGMHLSPEFGLTYKVIEEDGFVINAKVEMLLSSDTPVGITKSVGMGVIGFADALDRLRPDLMVVLGDRFEILAATQAALFFKIPVAHIGGGEKTEGALDDAIRHTITKMAHLHFVGAEPYRQRVIQLGENPVTVFNAGDLSVDNIVRLLPLGKAEIETSVGFKFRPTTLLVTYHPVTLGVTSPESAMRELLNALDEFPDAGVIFTYPNSDAGGRVLIDMIEEYATRQAGRVLACPSLGHVRYLSVMKYADVVLGNSSSGIVEAPVLKKATVNIGPRQDGRLKARSIIDCAENGRDIVAAVRQALSPEFQDSLLATVSLYGGGNSSQAILGQLKAANLQSLPIKKFYDVDFCSKLK